jgi:prephenate dehydrogenase
MREVFAQVAPALPADAVLTDVGSTKAGVIDDARAALGAVFPRFVPAHPIAGKERPGVEHADAGLFDGKRVIVTPTAATRPDALVRVERLFASTGARVERMEAAEHDRIFAAVSHLPHLLSFALIAAIGCRSGRPAQARLRRCWLSRLHAHRCLLAGHVARYLCFQPAALGEELRGYRSLLDRLQQAVDAGDVAVLQQTFEQASRLRRQWSASFDAE